jgi:hypothetical protein
MWKRAKYAVAVLGGKTRGLDLAIKRLFTKIVRGYSVAIALNLKQTMR